MDSSTATFRPAKLWRGLSEDRRIAAANAFWSDEHAVAEQAEMVGIIARQINFRPKSVFGLPPEKKARLLVRSVQIPDLVAARLLVAYHLAEQRPMMKAFLDAVGMAHDDGLLADDVKPPEREKLLAAGKQLGESYPKEDVRLYFTTLIGQDPETWGALSELVEEDQSI